MIHLLTTFNAKVSDVLTPKDNSPACSQRQTRAYRERWDETLCNVYYSDDHGISEFPVYDLQCVPVSVALSFVEEFACFKPYLRFEYL